MKKVKLIMAILLTLALLAAVILAGRLVLGMVGLLQQQGEEMVDILQQDDPAAGPTPTPYPLSAMAYAASEPHDEPDDAAPQEELVTVPVLETAEELAAEAARAEMTD